jgi:hypothetical protein
LFQREGYPIQVFVTVNNFLQISLLAATLSNTALDGPLSCGAVLIADWFLGSTIFLKKLYRSTAGALFEARPKWHSDLAFYL